MKHLIDFLGNIIYVIIVYYILQFFHYKMNPFEFYVVYTFGVIVEQILEIKK